MAFAGGIRKLKDQGSWDVDMFTIQDLISEHRNTNGFVKVRSIAFSHLVAFCHASTHFLIVYLRGLLLFRWSPL
jgi:hypothetical protein